MCFFLGLFVLFLFFTEQQRVGVAALVKLAQFPVCGAMSHWATPVLPKVGIPFHIWALQVDEMQQVQHRKFEHDIGDSVSCWWHT